VAIVTLTTDFGTSDGYVGAMKGVLLQRAPNATIVDITHDIARHDVVAAAFALAQSAPHFPRGTIHVVVVDPGVGGQRLPVAVDDGSNLFIGPDNGVFSLAAPSPTAAYAIEAPGFRAEAPSSTFHGRDIFAFCAGRLADGASVADAGPSVELLGALPFRGDQRGDGDSVFARVIHVDRFGNLITDFRGDKLPANPRFHARGRRITALSQTYESVGKGELLVYVGSGGTIEIAVREGSAADELDMARGDALEIVAGDA
jgi:S-adenosylmethionine hydrolase